MALSIAFPAMLLWLRIVGVPVGAGCARLVAHLLFCY